MGAEPWPDQNPVQIGGAISSERAIFVTTVLFIQQAPSGELIADYAKQHLVPGFEARFKPGDEDVVRLILGARFGIAVCKDMDFAQLGRAPTRGWAQMPCWCQPMTLTGTHGLMPAWRCSAASRVGSVWSGRPVTGF
jgi:predicted amidohydrolase